MEILRGNEAKNTFGCDVAVKLDKEKRNGKIKLLQLTDLQIIDSEQRRTPDRLRIDEINAWRYDKIMDNAGNHIKSLISQAKPDMIFITGDIIYGSFDDSGKVFAWFCEFMDSFEIPWAPVFGNHDNESEKGVAWQCDMFENSKYCLFKRGNVTGNGNYTVGICAGDELVRVFYMLDSHGCYAFDDTYSPQGIFPDQLEMVKKASKLINEKSKKPVPGFMAFHIPTDEFTEAEIKKGYATEGASKYIIGVDVEAKDGDFGSKQENFKKENSISVPGFLDTVKECNVQGVFVGHFHKNNTCILYEGVKWVFGLKTGQYDYHMPGQLGGTLVTLEGDEFYVSHLPAIVNYAPFAIDLRSFENFFADGE